MRALAQLGAVLSGTPAAASSKPHAPRRTSRGTASSAGRGSATHGSPSENSPPNAPSPKSAAGSATLESAARAPLASSFNRPRVPRRPAGGGKHNPQALDFGVEVFVPPGTPPHAASSGIAEQPERSQSPAAAELTLSSAEKAGTGEKAVSPSADPPSGEVPERLCLLPLTVAAAAPAAEAAPDKGHILRPPASSASTSDGAAAVERTSAESLGRAADSREATGPFTAATPSSTSAAAVDAAEAEHPEVADSSDAADEADVRGTAAEPGWMEHRSHDGITVRMHPSTVEMALQQEPGYTGYDASIRILRRPKPDNARRPELHNHPLPSLDLVQSYCFLPYAACRPAIVGMRLSGSPAHPETGSTSSMRLDVTFAPTRSVQRHCCPCFCDEA